MGAKQILNHNLVEHLTYVQDALASDELANSFAAAGELLVQSLGKGGKVLVCGNGGSASDAIHFAEELVGNFREQRKPFAAIALSDPGNLTCIANDFGFEQVFSRQVAALGKSGDVLLAISTSGNSSNIIEATKVANELGMKVIGLSAGDGGQLKLKSDVLIATKRSEYSDRIQEMHILLLHSLVEHIEKSLV